MNRIVSASLLALVLCCISARGSVAQYPFGKNKVMYAPKDWKVIETRHIEIYYYPDELPIAEFIASRAESIFAEYAAFFAIECKARVPVILYGTHHDFKETNVTPYLVSESTAGFTEFIKGRIALPFDGSYPKLEKVFRHELAHAFMIEKLHVVMAGRRHLSYREPPLWFIEGLAEFLANHTVDTEAHMFLRDAVTSGLVYPLEEIWRIEGTFLMYKEGESVLHYIATRFGAGAVRLILENWWKSDRFDLVIEKTLGTSLRELSEGWQEYLKRRYYPSILGRRNTNEIGDVLWAEEPGFENHPVCYEQQGKSPRFFCVGYDLGSINVLELKKDKNGKWRKESFVRGGRSNSFESIPTMRSRISIKGDTLVFVSKAGERDWIYLYGIERRRVLKRFSMPSARILSSPALSPDGRAVAYSAIDGRGKSDLYVYYLGNDTFERVTNDYYDDVNPDWHPTENLLVFSSDRCGATRTPAYALYTIDTKTHEPTALTEGVFRDVDPRWLPDGKGVLFSSDREGAPDIFLLRDGLLTRQTNVLGGAFSPSPCGAKDTFLCASYSNGTFRCSRVPLKAETRTLALGPSKCGLGRWEPTLSDGTANFAKKDYRIKLGLDFIGATFAVDPDFGSTGNGAQLFLTDMLGNHQVVLLFGTASDSFDDFFKRINVAITYVNLEHRLNYAVGAFHLASYMGSYYDLLRFERRYGILGGVSYPLSVFSRVEVSTVFKGMERDDDITFLGLEKGNSWLVSNFLSFTFDNIVWYVGGPLNGRRFNVAVGNTMDLKGSRYESTTLHFDFRHYVTLTDRVVFAQRIVSRNAFGSDLQLFYLGGSWDLRGYRFREFVGKRTLLVNNELRFPLIDRFVLKFPVGMIEFPLFRGSLFVDAGRVGGFIYDTDWLGSLGAGVEMNLGYLPVMRVNFSRLTDFKTVESDIHVDIFLGFNF
jgi:Tol biopolymer transport system component